MSENEEQFLSRIRKYISENEDKYEKPFVPEQSITVELISKRNLLPKEISLPTSEKADIICNLSHIRLDRENIASLDNIDCLGSVVTNLYLQWNNIISLTPLSQLTGVTFLSLSHNKIESVTGLLDLKHLKLLDVSHNNISDVDCEHELPSSIIILSLIGNPCCSVVPNYPHWVIGPMKKLKVLDGDVISRAQRGHAESVYYKNSIVIQAASSSESSDDSQEYTGSSSDAKTESDGDKVDLSVEGIVRPEQLVKWKDQLNDVKVVPLSSESDSDGNANTVVSKKKTKKKKKGNRALLKAEKERKQLQRLGINPAHFRDLTVRLLGRSRIRTDKECKAHLKRMNRIDKWRDKLPSQSARVDAPLKSTDAENAIKTARF